VQPITYSCTFSSLYSKDKIFPPIFAQNPARQGSKWSSQMSLEETEAMQSLTIGEGDGDAPKLIKSNGEK